MPQGQHAPSQIDDIGEAGGGQELRRLGTASAGAAQQHRAAGRVELGHSNGKLPEWDIDRAGQGAGRYLVRFPHVDQLDITVNDLGVVPCRVVTMHLRPPSG